MMAQLFRTVFARDAGVRLLGKAFRMPPKRDLPTEHQQKRHTEKRPRKRMRNKHVRSKHHGKIPIINPAGRTAFILHKPRLERTEEQNADHIAYTISKTDQN